MACTPAEACKAALAQATAKWHNRSKASDGICGDAAHQARPSDHNAGEAWDLTHDPAHGVDSYRIADQLRSRVLSGREKRVKYIISNRRIFNASISPNWRPYGGSNPHTKHCHVSILHSARNDTSPWFLETSDPVHAHPTPLLGEGDGGPWVKDLQTHLNKMSHAGLVVDGDFGAKTETAVRQFQSSHGLTPDGWVGPKTWKALGH